MSTVLITGGTGLIGKALGRALLKRGYKVIIVSRKTPAQSSEPALSYARWDVGKQMIDRGAVSSADYIIHLAGEGVAEKRWTKKRKHEIVNSRVQSSQLLVKSLREIPNKVRAVISASAIGWYGPDTTVPSPYPFTEEMPSAVDFIGYTCKQWEESIQPVATLPIRLVIFRIGIVLSREGGALKEFIQPLRWGIAAVPGRGKQMMSWIHIDDLVNIFIASIKNENMNGVYNAVSPNPVSNRELVLALARSRRRFFIPFRIPSFFLRLFLGELSAEILKSATVSCCKIQQTGFQFKYPDIQSALKKI
ncbi:MAG: TIGR01777 family protein [Bacteroidetes bacterium]|nr:TIGR01777 family protein [Bacteroidota bacterium]